MANSASACEPVATSKRCGNRDGDGHLDDARQRLDETNGDPVNTFDLDRSKIVASTLEEAVKVKSIAGDCLHGPDAGFSILNGLAKGDLTAYPFGFKPDKPERWTKDDRSDSEVFTLVAYLLGYGLPATFLGTLLMRAPTPLREIGLSLLVIGVLALSVRLVGRYTRGDRPW